MTKEELRKAIGIGTGYRLQKKIVRFSKPHEVGWYFMYDEVLEWRKRRIKELSYNAYEEAKRTKRLFCNLEDKKWQPICWWCGDNMIQFRRFPKRIYWNQSKWWACQKSICKRITKHFGNNYAHDWIRIRRDRDKTSNTLGRSHLSWDMQQELRIGVALCIMLKEIANGDYKAN